MPLCIFYSIRKLPATLVEDSPNDHHQPSASDIHRILLVHQKEEGPQIDPISCPIHNLKKIGIDRFVKYYIITTIPNFPKNSTNFNPDMRFGLFWHSFKPISKQIGYIG